jgi:RecT family
MLRLEEFMPEAIHFTDAEKAAFRAAYAPSATDDQFALFINECEGRALRPGTHVVFNLRQAKEWNPDLKQNTFVKKVALITTINGLRLIAERSGKYDGHGPFIYYYGIEGGDLKESKIPLGKIPHAVSVEGYRKDWKYPLFATARYDAYVQTKDDGGKKVPTMMWATRGEEQLAKCAEAQMLRTVAPEECAGLLITEELGNDVIDKEDNTPVTPVAIPQPITAPAVNQGMGTASGMPPGLKLVMAPAPEELAAITTVQAPCGGQVPPVDPKPQPPAPSPAQVTAAPGSGSLFDATTPPPPEQETRVFPPEVLTIPPPPPPKQVSVTVNTSPTVSEAAVAVAVAQATTPALADAPCDQATFNSFTGRAAKIVRDKLPKAGMKDSEASLGVKNYLLKVSGQTALRQIGKVTFEKLLKVLEDGTPEDAAAIIRAQK